MQQEQEGDISIPLDEEAEERRGPSDTVRSEGRQMVVEESDIGAGGDESDEEEEVGVPEPPPDEAAHAEQPEENSIVELTQEISLDDDEDGKAGKLEHHAPAHVEPRRYAEEHGFGNRTDDPSNRHSPVSHMHNDSNASSQQISEAEDAGLDFNDINLGPSHNVSPYGAGAHFASRSAIEIRQDSISSESSKAKELARMQEVMQRASTSSSTSSSSQHRISGERAEATAEDGTDIALEEEARTPKPAGITMVFANEQGELDSVISPINELAATPLDVEVAEENGTTEDVAGKPEESMDSAARSSVGGHREAESGTAASPQAVGYEHAPTSLASAEMPSTTTPASPTLTDAADREPQGKRRDSSKPSALEQHLSRTRMTTLPPKSKLEDVKHLHDFESMMKLSREMEQKKQQEEEERRNKRDASLQERMKVWEKEILPSWTRARREARLRKLWWKGVPPNLRGRVWALACGNSQMLPRNLFNKARAEAKEAQRVNSFNALDLDAIEADIEETLPSLQLFQKDRGALSNDLHDVLCAFTMVRADQLQAQMSERESVNGLKPVDADAEQEASAVYPIGVASLAAMLLINLSPSETLIALINLIAERPWLRALYSLSATREAREMKVVHRRASQGSNGTLTPLTPTARSSMSSARRPYDSSSALAGFERVFDTLLADQMPKVYANMQAQGVRPSAYVNDWIRTLFVPYLPFDAVARLWDCFLLEEKDALLFKTGIALVSLLSARLYVPERDELVSILHGNNRAAIAVWTRVRTNGVEALASPTKSRRSVGEEYGDGEEGPRSPVASVFAPDENVPRDDIYGGQYGVTERTLFDALEEQEGWWKDSILERLLDREIVS